MARLEQSEIPKFILAGKSYFTVKNTETGNRFTFRVKKLKSDEKDLWFVSVLTGPDNTRDYQYLGTIFGDAFRLTAKSKFSTEAPSVKAFQWFWRNMAQLPAQIEVYHEGRCGRCGRKLTVPESVASGYGPECIGLIK